MIPDGAVSTGPEGTGEYRSEWGWAAPDGGPIPVRDEAEARSLVTRMAGSVHRRTVGPWRRVPSDRDRNLAAAKRRAAVEMTAGLTATAPEQIPSARQLLDQADALDGSTP